MKVGIVGGGQIATVHIPYVRSHPGAEVVGLTDTDEGRAKTTAARFGIANTTRTLAELIERHRPDVVHIVTPPQTHAALAIQAMEAGCHVFVEKPMAVNLEEAEAMEAASRRYGVKLCVDHNHLFDPAMVQAKAMVRSLQSARYDTWRAKAELGWKPRVDFEEAVRRVGKDARG